MKSCLGPSRRSFQRVMKAMPFALPMIHNLDLELQCLQKMLRVANGSLQNKSKQVAGSSMNSYAPIHVYHSVESRNRVMAVNFHTTASGSSSTRKLFT